ncbi:MULTISPECIES: TetR/AcrR family transcriptional regulator [unclassified Pseudomonas]|jgi:TetR/AcrR family transcriptional repressor of nem operon|uniref:TetR/AcrR family transcriptional regulator n=1 Tax=unclassified Pseudomonas TaxID=196821 RepID=UPI0008B54056|nr:TetR/AcrR family transcriptional regulator [Pseudomonas sp. NFR16]SEJ78775.1 transcriptional regulator, TetR family [Pseudomonas sp. NFR16]
MSRSQAEKAAIHEHIVDLAAARFREVGLNGIGVADLMKEAGRTGGGFYKHFESREKLVEEALQCAFDKRASALEKYTEPDSTLTMSDLVERYLSERHLNDPGSGCAFAALVNDVARSSDPVREMYAQGLEKEFATLASLSSAKQSAKKRAQAVMAMCTLVGAIGLARAVKDEDMTAEILNVGKTLLKALDA